MSEREELEQAISALEAQRAVLGDAVVDASQSAMREKLAALDAAVKRDQQRKQVTILFMDVVGSTDIVDELDPEDNLAILDTALRRLSEPVNRHGGRVTRYMGDGFMALFGHPVASEHDPDNAVHAALGILEEAQTYSAEIAARWSVADFNVRVGIDTGLVIIGGGSEGENTLAGTAVNLAARLEDAAQPGSVLISHSTYQHVRGVFDLQPVQLIQAKGFADPVRSYQVLRAKARSFRTRRRGVEGVETRLIGRQSEFKALQDAYTFVLTKSERRMITIVGEAGLGKSRLLYEFENWVDLQPADVTLFRGRARQETKHQPYSLFRDLFSFRFGLQDDDRAENNAEKFVAGFRDVFDDGATSGEEGVGRVEMEAHFAGHMLGFGFSTSPHIQSLQEDPRQLHNRALIYLADYFKAAASEAPVLVLLEDLHWADDSSLGVLNRLALALRDQAALILSATRPEFFLRRTHWMEGRPFHVRLDLRPLSRTDSRLLTQEVLQRLDELPDALRDLIVANADGNPFFVEELVKMLIEEGVIVKEEPAWRVVHDRLGGVRVPPTLTRVLQARLDALPPSERTILQRASVVGRVFWEKTVAYLKCSGEPALDDEMVAGGLLSLSEREMVFRREVSAFAGATEHIFKHALLRDVTYEGVLKQTRREYHALAADWLIERSNERAGELSGLIADHLEQAGRVEEALDYLNEAATLAAAAYANEEAIEHYSRALDLLPKGALGTRIELLFARVRLHGLRGNRTAQRADLESLEETAALLASPETDLLIALEKATFSYDVGDFDGALEASKRAVEIAAHVGDREREVLGRRLMGLTLTQQGDYQRARRCLMTSLGIAREIADERGEGLTCNTLGPVAAAEGDFTQAREYYEQALALAKRSEDRYLEGAALNNLGTISKYLGDYSASSGHFERARVIAKEIGDRQGEGIALVNSGVIAADLGLYATAGAHYEDALALARDIGDRRVERITLGNLGSVALLVGNYDRAHTFYKRALALARELGDRHGEGYMLDGLSEAKLGLGNWTEAVDLAQKAVRLRETIGQKHLAIESRATLASAELAAGNVTTAMKQAEEVLRFIEAGGSLDGTTEPQRVLLRCIQIMRKSEDPGWKRLLETAFDQLQSRVEQIQGDDLRRSFLENIPWNREIIQLWEKWRPGI